MEALASTLGTYDRCPRCHQLCDADVPCPNCSDAPDPLRILLTPPESIREPVRFEVEGGEEVNGHRFMAGERACVFCGASLEAAVRRKCGQ